MAEACNSICRLCANKLTHDSLDIFGTFGINARVSGILFQHFGIEVLVNDGNSSRICPECWSITDNFHNLYDTVKNANIEHDSANEAGQAASTLPTAYVESDKPLAHSHFKIEILDKNESLADDQTMIMEINVENADIEDGEEDDVKPEEATFLEFESEDDTAKDEVGCEHVDDVIDDDAAAADAERIERENEQIRQYYNMNCALCSVVFGTIHDAVKHYRRCHQQTGYLSCCDKKVFRRCMALDHIQKHLNPDLHRCPKCNKVYTNKSTLRSHMRRHKDIEAERFVCDQCPERYSRMHALAKHKRQEHNDGGVKEFGCDICGKFFVTKSVLANHIRGVHENAFAHMCHICAKTFKSKQVYDLHLQHEHLDTEPPKLQCSICGNWLKHEHSLRKHMARHGQTEEVCKLCNKVAPNRHALGNHMRYVHSERSYKCTMCDKAFKKPIGLKEHMASHMGVDLYFCPYCPKTFKSNANMHSHRKKKHLALWQHDREQRQKP